MTPILPLTDHFQDELSIIDPYTTFSMYGQGSGEISYADGTGNKTTAMVVTNLSNSSLKWEKTSSWNVGLDFGLFNSRLSGTLDIYQKKTTDLLISRNLPGSAGFSSTYYNQGSLKSSIRINTLISGCTIAETQLQLIQP